MCGLTASRDRNTSTGDDDNLLAFVQDIQDAIQLGLFVGAQTLAQVEVLGGAFRLFADSASLGWAWVVGRVHLVVG